MNYSKDKRIVLTLDAGGTNFVFSAMQAMKELVEPVCLPAEAKDLDKSLDTMIEGFSKVIEKIDGKPSAISFAFPGPADYPNGIIDNLRNLPAFAGGVALGPFLSEKFNIPVFINNDGDLFVYGEAIAGFLPKINKMLKDAGSPKRYKKLFGITLGTGFGGGLVDDGRLYIGDNSNATEIWLTRNKRHPKCFAEEGISIRAIQGSYARLAGIDKDESLTPKDIGDISRGKMAGDTEAAKGAFNEMGECIGDALANAITLLDGLIVIGGGVSKSYPLFIDAILKEMNGVIESYSGETMPRIVQDVYDMENPADVEKFVIGDVKEITVPGCDKTIPYDSLKRIGIGQAVLDTSQAVSIGAYTLALHELDMAAVRASQTHE